MPWRKSSGSGLDSFVRELERKSPESWVINLPSIGITNVKDIAFLEGYNEPTLVVLYEPSMTSTTRYAVSKNTCAVSLITIDLERRKFPIAWAQACPLRFFLLTFSGESSPRCLQAHLGRATDYWIPCLDTEHRALSESHFILFLEPKLFRRYSRVIKNAGYVAGLELFFACCAPI